MNSKQYIYALFFFAALLPFWSDVQAITGAQYGKVLQQRAQVEITKKTGEPITQKDELQIVDKAKTIIRTNVEEFSNSNQTSEDIDTLSKKVVAMENITKIIDEQLPGDPDITPTVEKTVDKELVILKISKQIQKEVKKQIEQVKQEDNVVKNTTEEVNKQEENVVNNLGLVVKTVTVSKEGTSAYANIKTRIDSISSDLNKAKIAQLFLLREEIKKVQEEGLLPMSPAEGEAYVREVRNLLDNFATKVITLVEAKFAPFANRVYVPFGAPNFPFYQIRDIGGAKVADFLDNYYKDPGHRANRELFATLFNELIAAKIQALLSDKDIAQRITQNHKNLVDNITQRLFGKTKVEDKYNDTSLSGLIDAMLEHINNIVLPVNADQAKAAIKTYVWPLFGVLNQVKMFNPILDLPLAEKVYEDLKGRSENIVQGNDQYYKPVSLN
jgi:hypothetical protein